MPILSSVPPQPFFEHVLYPNGTGISNTAFIAENMAPYPARGDVADTVDLMSYYGLLPANVGMAAQLSENTFFTDLGYSSYHGMLATLHKNTSHGLQFDLNYTWSHSIDNTLVGCQLLCLQRATGFICDVLRPRLCRGNSDFDVTQVSERQRPLQLPFGRGRNFANTIPLWADEAIGGWELSGFPSLPYRHALHGQLHCLPHELLQRRPCDFDRQPGGLQKSHVTVSNGVVYFFQES